MLKHNKLRLYLFLYKVVISDKRNKQKGEPQMYLGQLIAYPIWLYVGISVLFIVGSAIKNNKG